MAELLMSQHIFSACVSRAVASLGLVTAGAENWRCHPYIFFLKKTDDLFSCRLLVSHVVYPVFFSKFSHKKNNKFYSGYTPWMVSPGAVRPRPPPSDATVHGVPMRQ